MRGLRIFAVLGALAGPGIAAFAFADSVDTRAPATFVVGSSRAIAASERIDPRRAGRSRTALPEQPSEVWRKTLSAGLDVSPVVDESGAIIAALSVPEVVKLGSDGREVWRVRLGSAGALAPPVITPDGTIVVATADGVAWGLRPTGAVRFSVPIGVRAGRDLVLSPTALEDGGVVLVAGRVLVELGTEGELRSRATLDDRAVGPAVLHRGELLVPTERGDLYGFRPPGAPRKIGSFGGSPRGGFVLADRRTALAVVDGKRVVALDLPTATTMVRSGGVEILDLLDGPVTVNAQGVALATTTGGLLLGFDPTGEQRMRVGVERQAMSAADAGPGAIVSTDVRASPPLVVDAAGSIGFVRVGGRAGVVSADGRVSIASERICQSPAALLPAGERRMIVACHDGTISMLGDR